MSWDIKACLYCDGFTQECSKYTPLKNEVCLWYKVVENDLDKIAVGDKCLTFKKLEEIVKPKDL
jgi:hypothetical protein